MKINRDLTTFKPVTLTFETYEELKRFVDDIGSRADEHAIPYDTWNELHGIVYGSCSS